MHQNKHQNTNQKHVPVLLDEVLQYLDPKEGDSYLDLTAGYGGHAQKVLDITGNYRGSVLVDRDQHAINELTRNFDTSVINLIHQDFLAASQKVLESGQQFDCILADLGVSSPHLNEASRGFAIQADGPLDMRMDQEQLLSAATIVNTYDESELADLIKEYGEEPKARQIAQLIVEGRPFSSTGELAQTVAKAWPGYSRVHPATRTFQAIRIAVNNELGLLTQSLPLWVELLKPGGRLVVISFHSLEDRIVKQYLQQVSGNRYDAELQLLTKKPVTAASHEIVHNPRARSAKLRAAVKTKRKGN
ncbi:MAG: 16S rRNA (cytosine(1402)-N(4))-methyltransferase RsmH [Candidatus Saccharimonadales bacterium]